LNLVSEHLSKANLDLPQLPSGWIWVALEEIANHVSGVAFKSTDFITGGVQVIRLGNVYRGQLDLSRDPVYLPNIFLSDNFVLKPGDIVVSQTGTRFKRDYGNFVVIPENAPKLLLNQRLLAVRCYPAVENKYIFYASKLKFYQDHFFSNETGGVNQGNVGVAGVMKGPISLAPLNEQRRIVAKIEALKARSQRVKEALEDIPQLLNQFRQSVLAAAFRGDLTADWREQNSNVEPAEVLLKRIQEEFTHQNTKRYKSQDEFYPSLDQNFININFSKLPELWQLIQIRKICISSFYGPRFGKDEYVEDGIPSIRTTDMTDEGEIILQSPPKLNIPKEKLDDFKVLPGDLLVTRSGSIGVMAVFRGDYIAIPSAYLIRFRFSLMVSIDYIFYYLKSPIGQTLLGLNSTSVTQSNINAEAIKNIPIPIPPLEEQQEIVSRIKSLLKVVNQIKQQYQETKAHLDQLDQSILAKAFRGELVPQDPNDEPASVLLEHIRAERAKLQTKTAKKSTLRLGSVTTTKTSARRTKKTQPQQEESVQLDLGLE